MSFLWPRSPSPSPNALNRFGRVVHWTCTGLAAVLALSCAWAGIAEAISTSEYGPDYGASIVAGGFAIFFVLVGRGARYILSGE